MMASEMLRIRGISFVLGAILASGWLLWWLQPGRQLHSSVHDLLAALEDADRSGLEDLLAPGYSDPWHRARSETIQNAIEASKQFYSLQITPVDLRIVPDGPLAATVSFRPRIEGEGTAIAPMIRDRVAKLDHPFTLVWKRENWKPWSWSLHRVENPSLKSVRP